MEILRLRSGTVSTGALMVSLNSGPGAGRTSDRASSSPENSPGGSHHRPDQRMELLLLALGPAGQGTAWISIILTTYDGAMHLQHRRSCRSWLAGHNKGVQLSSIALVHLAEVELLSKGGTALP